MLRVALCDDNRVQLQLLKDAARGCKYWQGAALKIEEFTSGEDLLSEVYYGKTYDYIFLDIEMPGMDGLEAYSKLCEVRDSTVIFVSTHVERLPEVFESKPYGFLAKPYDQKIFDRTVKSVVRQQSEKQFYRFSRNGAEETVPCSKIHSFVIDDYILTMRFIEDDPLIMGRMSLDKVEQDLLELGFYRCNRSVLVNLRFCSGREDNNLVIKRPHNSPLGTKRSPNCIAIPRRKLKEFDRQLIMYKMGGKNAF